MSDSSRSGNPTDKRAVVSYKPKLSKEKTTYPDVAEVMDRSFVKLTPEMQIYDAIRSLLDNSITGATVVDEAGHLVGVLSEKDCLRVLLNLAYDGTPAAQVKDYMTTDITSIPSTMDITDVATVFLKNSFRRLPVVDEGKLVGQVTRRDLLRAIREIIRKSKGAVI